MSDKDNLVHYNNFYVKYQKLLTSSPLSTIFLHERLVSDNENYSLLKTLQVSAESNIEIIPAIIEGVMHKESTLISRISGSRMLQLRGFIKDVYDDHKDIKTLNEILFMDDQKWFQLSNLHNHFSVRYGDEKYANLRGWISDLLQTNTISLLKANLIYSEFISDKNLKKECARLIYKDILFLNSELKHEEYIIKHWTKNLGFDKNELKDICSSIDGGSFLVMEEPKTYYSIDMDLLKIQKYLKESNNLRDDFATINKYLNDIFNSFCKSSRLEDVTDFFIKDKSIKSKFVVLSSNEIVIGKFYNFVSLCFNEKFYEKTARTQFLNDLFDKFEKNYKLDLLLKNKSESIPNRKKI